MYIGPVTEDHVRLAKQHWEVVRDGRPWPLTGEVHDYAGWGGSPFVDVDQATKLLELARKGLLEEFTTEQSSLRAKTLEVAFGDAAHLEWKPNWSELLMQRLAKPLPPATDEFLVGTGANVKWLPSFPPSQSFERATAFQEELKVVYGGGGGPISGYGQSFATMAGISAELASMWKQYRGLPRYDIWLSNVIYMRDWLLKEGHKSNSKVIKDFNKTIGEMAWELKHHPDVMGIP